jgi:hypothetical protein
MEPRCPHSAVVSSYWGLRGNLYQHGRTMTATFSRNRTCSATRRPFEGATMHTNDENCTRWGGDQPRQTPVALCRLPVGKTNLGNDVAIRSCACTASVETCDAGRMGHGVTYSVASVWGIYTFLAIILAALAVPTFEGFNCFTGIRHCFQQIPPALHPTGRRSRRLTATPFGKMGTRRLQG